MPGDIPSSNVEETKDVEGTKDAPEDTGRPFLAISSEEVPGTEPSKGGGDDGSHDNAARPWSSLGRSEQQKITEIWRALGMEMRIVGGELCRKVYENRLDPSYLPLAQREDFTQAVGRAREAASADPNRFPERLGEELRSVDLSTDDVIRCLVPYTTWVKLPDLTDRQREDLLSMIQEAKDTRRSAFKVLEKQGITGDEIIQWLE
ncbi:MAG: hypothetical protein J2P36_16980, partial [Ktedonobacteraceae bacterium]|nr:hypothetical protein [Ktedonobacteraceae bacterium]